MRWPSFGGGFQTFYTSPQSRSYPCLIRVVPYGFMVYLDRVLDTWSIFNHNKGWYHPSPPCRFQTKMSFFLFTSLYSKRLFWVIFWANKGGAPEWFHFCAPFQGFPQVQYSCKTLKMLTAPNMDPQTIKTQVLYSLKKEVETNDAQTTRRPPMVHLDPDG